MFKSKKLKKIKYIIKECFSGTKNLQEIFTNIFLSEYQESSKKTWTSEQKNDIIQETDNSQISCLFKR